MSSALCSFDETCSTCLREGEVDVAKLETDDLREEIVLEPRPDQRCELQDPTCRLGQVLEPARQQGARSVGQRDTISTSNIEGPCARRRAQRADVEKCVQHLAHT